jgi:hypothetical protein
VPATSYRALPRLTADNYRPTSPATWTYNCVAWANGFTLDDPELPSHVTVDQAWHFAKSLLRGEKDRWAILKDVVKEQVREVG